MIKDDITQARQLVVDADDEIRSRGMCEIERDAFLSAVLWTCLWMRDHEVTVT